MQISPPNCSLSSQSFLSNLSLLSKVFSMIMFKIKWDLKPLSLNKNLKKVRLLRDLRLQASSNNGKRPCSNINITSNMKCYLNHVCRSKIKSGSCAACPLARRSLLKLATLLTCDFAAQYVGSIAYLVWGVRVRIPSKSEFTQASTELQRYSSQQIFDLQEDNRYMTLHCHLRGRFCRWKETCVIS